MRGNWLWRSIVSTVALTVGNHPVLAQSRAAQQLAGKSVVVAPLTLAKAIAVAQARYPAVAAADAERVAADGEIRVARTDYLPQVDLLAQINRATINNITGLLLPQSVIPNVSGPPFAPTGRSAWNSGVGVLTTWRPLDLGYRSARVDAARNAATAAGEDVRLTRLQVAQAAGNAYLNLLAAQALVASAGANVGRLQTFAKAVHVLVDNKLRAGVEGEQADAAVALAQSDLAAAQNNVTTQRLILAKFLAVPADRLVLDSSGIASSPPMPAAVAASADDHPAIARAQALVARSGADLRAIEHSADPTVDLLGSASARGSGRENTGAFGSAGAGIVPDVANWALGLQFRMPLGAIPRTRAQAASQRARVDAARARAVQVAADTAEDIARADADLASARRIAEITPVAVRAARTGEAQRRVQFEHGLAGTVEVATAQATLAQAESQDAIAQINVWRAAVALAVARGNPDELVSLVAPRS